MPSRIDTVLEKIQAGTGLVAVQDGDVREYARRFREKETPRPILAWDADGFRWISEESDKLPEIGELAACKRLAKFGR